MKNSGGWRETGNPDGRVIHWRVGAGIACNARGSNRQATTLTVAVNCKKCSTKLARIR